MAGLNVLCGDIDQEDIEYLQLTFQTILSGSRPSDLYSPGVPGLLQGPLGLIAQNDWSSDKSDWTVRSSSSNPNLRSDDSISEDDSGYTSFASSLMFLKCHYDRTRLFDDIISEGVDEEDINYLKSSFFNVLLWDVNEEHWMSKVSWAVHPPTAAGRHSGCARTEVYRKVDKLPRPGMRRVRRQPQQSSRVSSSFISTPYGKTYKGLKNVTSRNARNDQRRLYTAYESITRSSLLKLNELKFRKKKLRLGKSEIHGLGLFASENIPANDIIIEYVGEIIRPIKADVREQKYMSSGIGFYYFKIDDLTIVDATKHGNLGRFINHRCDPNSIAKILDINNKKKIVIYSKKSIKIGEEITYDYKLPMEYEKIACLCKAPGCRKTLN